MTGIFPTKSERAARSQLDLIIRCLVLIHRAEPSDALIRRLTKELQGTVSNEDIMRADVKFLRRADAAVLRSLGHSVPEAPESVTPCATRPESKSVTSVKSPKIG